MDTVGNQAVPLSCHCAKCARIQGFSGPYFLLFRETLNRDQNYSEYEHISGSVF